MKKSDRKVAVVTGSATGVGSETCKLLAELGWNVVVNYSKSEMEARSTAEACQKTGADVLLCQANVADDLQCKEMIDRTIAKWGRIDALVNNAGMTRFCPYNELDGINKADFLDIYEVNVVGAYQMARAAYPYLKQSEDGSVVNVSSISAISGVGSSIAYAASKGALSTMTKSLAVAFGPEIRVNGVCPGFIQGRWTKNFLGERYADAVAAIEQKAVLERTALPREIAEGIAFFICGNRLITGELLTMDGGALMQKIGFKR